MLATVEYGGVKKYIKIPQIDDIFDFQKFLLKVTDKFRLQDQVLAESGLHVTDESDIEVDGDTFDELIKSGLKNFKVGKPQSPASLPVPPASPALTLDFAAPRGSSSSSSDFNHNPSTIENRKWPIKDLGHDEAKTKTLQSLDPVLSSPSTASTATMALSKFGDINDQMEEKPGSPTIYQLSPTVEMVATLKKITIGKKQANKKSKAILLVGETGTGKSTLINALMNQALGVQWEDDVWFQFVENEQPSDGQQRNQADSQTSDVIVYQLFGFEGKPLPCPLTIIDTPGFGHTRGNDRDDRVKVRLSELFQSDDGVHEISAVGLVLKASENRVSDRLRYIFDSVMSLFGKDMEENIVALITHSDGLECANVLRALRDANVTLAKDEDDEPVYFMLNNRQHVQRTKKNKALKAAWDTTMTEIGQFREFVDQTRPQNVQKTV